VTKQPKSFLTRKELLGLIAVLFIVLAISYFLNPLGQGEKKSDAAEYNDVKKSIAVLPFKDMSPDQDQEYLGDGIAEEIINRLTKVNDLKVIGRTSSFSFKSKDTDLKTIGDMLGVETILEGSVQKSGNQLRITAQLINAVDGFHIWSERFDREFSDVFLLQDEMALIIATKIHSDIKNSENLSISSNSKIDPEAYEYYLKGKHLHFEAEWSDREKALKNSENMFFEALKINPNYGLAHAGLADLYNTYLNSFGYDLDSIESKKYLELQKENIDKAYQLNPNSDYVNLAKGWVHLEFGEIDSSYISFVRAIKLNPEDEFNYGGLAYFFQTRGLYNEAALIYEKAKYINPLDVSILMRSAFLNGRLKNYEKSIEESEVVILLEPNNFGPYVRIFYNLILMNKIDQAEDFLETAKNKFPDANFSFQEGLIYASKGEKEKALKISRNASWYYAKLGMKEEYITTFLNEYAYAKLSEEAIHQNYIWIINRTRYDWFKDDSRIQKIVQEEKEKYEVMKAKYGNLDFLDL
ncbi:MAG: hypothetical protein KAK04_05320, partial [Cyclobacteriaceae bacterium]|nr:hypothetical protein [Cyclobacteriaceae bacterium]